MKDVALVMITVMKMMILILICSTGKFPFVGGEVIICWLEAEYASRRFGGG